MSAKFRRSFAVEMGIFASLIDEFRREPENYPSSNAHLYDEVAASIIMGRMRNFTYDFLSPAENPWFVEWRHNQDRYPGTVIHTGFTPLIELYRFLSAEMERDYTKFLKLTRLNSAIPLNIEEK